NIMRNSRHLKVITSQIENLEDLKSQLETIGTHVLTVIEKAELWIEEKENDLTFLEMSQFLMIETSKFIMKCHNIASDNNESAKAMSTSRLSVETSLSGSCTTNRDEKEFEILKERLEKMEKTISTHSRKYKTVNQKLKALENYSETIHSQTEQNDWIMQELNSASEFMTQIQSENELLTERITSHEHSVSKLNGVSESWQLKQKRLEEQVEQLQKTIQTNEKSSSMKVEELGKEVHVTNLAINSSNKKFVVLQDNVTALGVKVGDVSLEMQTLCNKVEEIASKVYQSKEKSLAQSSNTATDKLLDYCQLQDVLNQVVLLMENTKDYPSMYVVFSAHVDLKTTEWTLKKNMIVNCFRAVSYSLGGYDPKTGIFTASCYGIHRFRVSICTSTDQHIQLGLFKEDINQTYQTRYQYYPQVGKIPPPQRKSSNSRNRKPHQMSKSFGQCDPEDVGEFDDDFIISGNLDQSQCSDETLVATSLDQVEKTERMSRILCNVQLNQGDKLYVRSLTTCPNLQLNSYSQFKCSFLV
ncbi:lamin protein, partial [Biomphalaria glabrata]